MTTVRPLRCPTCGADLPAHAFEVAWAVCEYCRTPLAIDRPQHYHPLMRGPAGMPPPAAPPPRETAAAHAPPAAPGGQLTVRLLDAGPNKIMAIKAVRELTGLGLAETKTLVESAPREFAVTAQGMWDDEVHRRLRDAGCRYELQGEASRQPPPPQQQAQAVYGGAGAFQVVLEQTGPNKIAVIKEIRELTNLGLKEAKDLSEQLPSRFRAANPSLRAADVVARFAAVGARVRIEPA